MHTLAIYSYIYNQFTFSLQFPITSTLNNIYVMVQKYHNNVHCLKKCSQRNTPQKQFEPYYLTEVLGWEFCNSYTYQLLRDLVDNIVSTKRKATFAVASFQDSSAQFKPAWCSNFNKLSNSLVIYFYFSLLETVLRECITCLFFHHSCCSGRRLFLKLYDSFVESYRKNGYYTVSEKKTHFDSRSVKNISDKRLRIDVQPSQTNGVERVKRFVNNYLHLS